MKKRFLAFLCAVCIAVVSFGAIAVSAEQSTLIEWDYITSAKPGNIFSDTDAVTFTQDIKNKAAQNIVSNYTWNITDEEGNTVDTVPGTDNIAANASITRTISVKNPKKYGIYTINVTEENYTVSAPGNKFTETYSEKFSVCISLDSSNIDEGFGFNQTVVNGEKFGLDDYQTTVDLMKKAGAKWHRESVMWAGVEPETLKPGTEYVDGKYIKLDTYKEKLVAMKASGIKTVCVLTGLNSKYNSGMYPVSNADINAYADFCAYVVSELKDVVDTYEVWNEWNLKKNGVYGDTQTYAKVLKAAYTAIKAVDENITVVGCDCAGISVDWIDTVLDTLESLDNTKTYMDAISVHCYDYEAANGFPEKSFMGKVANLKAMLAEHNLNVPIWLSEIGFSTYESSELQGVPSCTKDEQLNAMVMLNAVNKAYGLFDKIIQYCFYDAADLSNVEANWGLLNCWERDYTDNPEAKLLPNGAKPSFLGVAAMNYFVGGNTEFRNVISDDVARSYLFEFYNNNLNENVILAINGGLNNTVAQNIQLGCKSINIYDKYGNLKEQMASETGEYTVETYSEPIYIVGNSTEFDVHYSDMRIRASVDLNTQAVTISGKTDEPNDLVSVMVTTKGTNVSSYDASTVHYIAQTVSDSEGEFAVQYNADQAEDTYRIHVNTEKRRSKVAMNMVYEYTVPKIAVVKDSLAVTKISDLQAGDNLTIKLAGLETTAENSPKIAVAQYDGSKLKSIKWINAVGKFKTLGNEFMSDFTVAEGASRIKIVYWSSDSLTPLVATYDIK